MMKIMLLRWQSVVDFFVLATVLYYLMIWAWKARVLRLLAGIGGLAFAGSVARRLDLVVTAWAFHLAVITAVVILVVVYHAEIRHALTHLDPFNRLVRPAPLSTSEGTTIAEAAFSLAAARRGALPVLKEHDALESLTHGGVPLGGRVSREILEAIFRKVSPVHDGAVVIEEGRISHVGVFLPLTSRADLPSDYGTRHRAAVGLAEQSDAMIIVVSEERGEVTVVHRSGIRKVAQPAELVSQIEGFIHPVSPSLRRGIGPSLLSHWKFKLSALGITFLVWGFVLLTSHSILTFTLPLELRNVPPGLEVSQISNSAIAVQLRAAPELFALLQGDRLAARIDLRHLPEGTHTIEVEANALDLPPGIFLERASPHSVTLRLARRRQPS